MFFKQTKDNYIECIGTGVAGTEIPEAEYKQIMSVIKSCPREQGKVYKLRTDLTWEVFDATEEELEDSMEGMSTSELKALMTELGISSSMTKQNMIDLINNRRMS